MRAGKVRYIGCSNYAAWQLDEGAGRSPSACGLQRFVSQQIYYSLQAREAEYELVPASLDQGLGSSCGARWPAACCRASTAATRRRRRGRHLTDWDEPPVRDQEQLYDIVDALVEIGEGHGVSAAQVALAYMLAGRA